MRLNVYAEELTHQTEIVTKHAEGKIFYGIRLYLTSPDVLHHTEKDDDRSAVTFWVPFTSTGGNDFLKLGQIFQLLIDTLHQAEVNAR